MRRRKNEPCRPEVRRDGFGFTGRHALPRLVLVLGLLLVGGAPCLAGGKGSEGFFVDRHREFEADADADVYGGPAPLAVKFSARAIHTSGRVTYRWTFDDRTTSTEQNPAHTFRRQGWYNVTMDARDGAGHTYRMNLLVHAWRPKDWARLQAHRDMRIVARAARELERKRSRAAAAPPETLSASGVPADGGRAAPR